MTRIEDQIAVVGMAGRFPGAKNVDELWCGLRDEVESIRFFSDEELLSSGVSAALIADPNYVKAFGVLDDVDLFDSRLFKLSPRDAEIMDPQQRFFLECSWEAFEDAGWNPRLFPGRVGVYAGASLSTYLLRNIYPNQAIMEAMGTFQVLLSNDKDFVPTRVSHHFDLTGPSCSINTACSTSLVAVHHACQALLSFQCDMALAGGVSIDLPQISGYTYQQDGILSPDGRCRAYDATAQGAAVGNGVGVVVLKRLDDAIADGDGIHAVILGSAVNNDGAQKIGYSAPGIRGQTEVIAEALAVSQVPADTISYVEGHGTGTPLGDSTEVAALTNAFRKTTDRVGFCGLGSVKTNIGHLGAAAGVVGLIKTVLALENKLLPASLHCTSPNPELRLEDSPFEIVTKPRPWTGNGTPLRAGVSSFGMGGTNAHMILQEAPTRTTFAQESERYHLRLSAQSQSGLERTSKALARRFRDHSDLSLGDIEHTLRVGRTNLPFRRVVACSNISEFENKIEQSDYIGSSGSICSDSRPVSFLFPGGGAQHPEMGRGYYEHDPVFRDVFNRVCEMVTAHSGGIDPRISVYGSASVETRRQQLQRPLAALPALFATEVALAETWISRGIEPTAMIGHSLGEYVAACVAEVVSLSDAVALVVARARLFETLPRGAMLGIELPEERLDEINRLQLCVAAINAPGLCVLSGAEHDVAEMEEDLKRLDISSRRIRIDVAAHSKMLEPILAEFFETVQAVEFGVPKRPYISNLTGTWITPDEATSPKYWVEHLRRTVKFGEGIRKILQTPNALLLEVGPSQVLSTLARQQTEREHTVLSGLPHPQSGDDDWDHNSEIESRLWLEGIDLVNPSAQRDRAQRIPLPSRPFEHTRHWIEAPSTPTTVAPESIEHESSVDAPNRDQENASQPPSSGTAPRNELETRIAKIWSDVLGIERLGIHDDFFELGAHSLLLTRISSRLRDEFGVVVALRRLFSVRTVALMADLVADELIREATPADLDAAIQELDDETSSSGSDTCARGGPNEP